MSIFVRKITKEIIIGCLLLPLCVACNHKKPSTQTFSEDENLFSEEDSLVVEDSGIIEPTSTLHYDTLLYGVHSQLLSMSRSTDSDSSQIVDTLCYIPNRIAQKRPYQSADLKMNALRGPVKAIYVYTRPYLKHSMLTDSTWQLTYRPFSTKESASVDSTLYTKEGKFSRGTVVYNNWHIIPNKDTKVKRDPSGRILDVTIDEKEFGVLGSRYFYTPNGYLKYYNVCGYENGYKVTCQMSDGLESSYEMEGIRYGEPYLYKRSFAIVDSDEYGNWTVRLCKEVYYPGKLYLREGQENEEENNGFTKDDIDSWDQIIEWQNSWDKQGPVSQFAIFEEHPTKLRRWIEIRKICYY